MSDTPTTERDLELLDQILELQHVTREPGDPSDFELHLLDDQGHMVWWRFGDRTPGQLVRTLAYLKAQQGSAPQGSKPAPPPQDSNPTPPQDSKPPRPDPQPAPPAPEPQVSKPDPSPPVPRAPARPGKQPLWPIWGAAAALALGLGARHWWENRSPAATPSTAVEANAPPPQVAPNAPAVVGGVVEPDGTAPQPVAPAAPTAVAPAAKVVPARHQIAHPSTALGVNGPVPAPVPVTPAPAPFAAPPAPAPVAASPTPAPTPAPAVPAPAAEEPNDLLHIGEHLVGYKPEPKALTREQSLQRIRDNPWLLKGPICKHGEEIWATYPDGGRERVPCHP